MMTSIRRFDGRGGAPGAPILAVLVLIASLGAAPAAPASAAQPFTVEEVLSAPYPTSLVAAEDAPRIAWIENRRGVRNAWTAAAPGWEPVRLTEHAEDDGVPMGPLLLTPDGTILLYGRGGGTNQAGERPNPSSDPDGPVFGLWAVPTDGSAEPRRIAGTTGPVLSPAGDRIAWSEGGRVVALPLSGLFGQGEAEAGAEDEAGQEAGGEASGDDGPEDEKPEPEELFQSRGNLGGLAWAPDARRIAFVSDRGSHAFVGVFDPEAAAIRWIDPGVDRDGWPAWSPDGTRLAFLRTPGRRAGEVFDLTSGQPFAVRLAEVGAEAAGSGPYPSRELWASPGDDGGFAQYYPDEPLRWAAGDRILFTSEHEGPDGRWLHVHALPGTAPPSDAPAEPLDLTPGACLAEQTALSPDRVTLWISSNCGDPDRRHLWRVAVASAGEGPVEPVQVTSGDGIETDPVPLVGGTVVAFRRATALRPQAVSLVARDGGAVRTVAPELPEEFPRAELVVPEAVSFQAADGTTVHGQLFLPPPEARSERSGPDGRMPAVLFLHGGPIRQMLLGWHPRHYYARTYAMNQLLASRGTAVLAVNFRSGIGYGTGFRRAEAQGPRGASEYQDVLAAARYLRERGDVDPERIGLWGGSYGGYLTALSLARDSDVFAAGVDLHGVHDWALRATDFIPGGAWGLTEELLEEARESSPVADLETWSSPVLLIHGDDDRNVLFLQTVDLAQRLRERGVEVEVLVLPDEVHGFLRHASWVRALRATAAFFGRTLAGAAD